MDHRETALEIIARAAKSEGDRLASEMELVADLGLDSSRALGLMVDLEEQLEIEIGDDDIGRLNTVGDILDYVERAVSARPA